VRPSPLKLTGWRSKPSGTGRSSAEIARTLAADQHSTVRANLILRDEPAGRHLPIYRLSTSINGPRQLAPERH
jgi:hypothetical protein